MLETPDPSVPTVPDPRAAELRRQLTAIAAHVLDTVLGQVDLSTGSLQERMISRTLKPVLPRIRHAFLLRLSEADGATLERLMGATSSAIESMLYYAPGEPLERWIFEFGADGSVLIKPAPTDEPEEAPEEAPDGVEA